MSNSPQEMPAWCVNWNVVPMADMPTMPTNRARRVIQWPILVALFAVALLAGCGGAITEKRAKLATPQQTPAQVTTATPQPTQIQDTPPHPASVGQFEGAGIEGGTWVDVFATVSAGLLFVAVCGGAMGMYALVVARVFIRQATNRRNSQLFTTGGNNQ